MMAGFKSIEKKKIFSLASTQIVATNNLNVSLTPEEANETACSNLYDSLQLAVAGLSKEAFRYAWFGFQQAGFSKPILAIADFSQSSRHKRLYVIDFLNKKVLLNTYVAHGRNSGQEYASKFSNANSSYQSSLGFYKALGTYHGKHGLSLRLQGLEKNINDQAFERAIVMHGADYVSEDFIRQTGRLGRSLGCPAVSQAEHQQLIKLLRNGAGLFLYYPDANYLSKSKILHQAVAAVQRVVPSNS
ncbi:hypothetical protein GBK04_02295 [Cytophagaceae bacterium SJW1-29]|uniref:Murein L,D-transpeptidase catalytic domain family protein n=2 Tax=Salmonirosea aquatica TaxID=2654236 RepID=A0A7C9F4L1_9BACT|nr:hypothetical protein [Cytophagaceae bacterium SJW1-29]